MTRREMFSESDHAHGTEKLYKAHMSLENYRSLITMSSTFQRTFQHLAAADNTINGPPPLIPAPFVQVPQPTALPTPYSQSPSALGPSSPAPSAAAPTSSSQFEFINSTRGKPKLVHGGYIYVYHKYCG